MHFTKEMLEKYTDQYGNIDLRGTNVTSLPDKLTVRGSLNIRNTHVTSLPYNLHVGGNLSLGGTEIKSLPRGLKVGRDLNIDDTGIKSLPVGLKVCGSLHLSGTEIKSLPKDLVVGCWLNTCDSLITSLPTDLKVGFLFSDEVLRLSDSQRLHNGDYVPNKYIYANGILTLIERAEKIGDYTYYRGLFPGKNVITDGVYYEQCSNFESGIQYLELTNRAMEPYQHLDRNSIISKDNAISMYQAITEASDYEIERLIRILSIQGVKTSYTIQEVIDLTRYRYSFDNFDFIDDFFI